MPLLSLLLLEVCLLQETKLETRILFMHMPKESTAVKDDGIRLRQIFGRNGYSECNNEDKKALGGYQK